MRHSYTNITRRDGGSVVKTYAGPDAARRQAQEVLALGWVAQWLPVPELTSAVPGTITTRFVDGHPGQDLMETPLAYHVLQTCGRLLRELQRVPPLPGAVVPLDGVLVHGDFGPHNVLLTGDAAAPVLVADWEWCGAGSRLTDLGWCEFIVREHHPAHIPALQGLFDGYGDRPDWADRQAAMTERARSHLEFVRMWPGTKLVAVWEKRVQRIGRWEDF